MNQLYVYIHSIPLGPPSHLTCYPTCLAITEHRAELPVLYSRFPVAIHFTHDSVCMWAFLVAQLVKNSPAMQETPVQFLDREDPMEKG